MHPLLRQGRAIAAYLFVWFDVGLLVAILLSLTRGIHYMQAALFAIPLTLLFALIGLSAFWVCRAAPLGTSTPWRVGGVSMAGALQAALVWALAGGLWARVFAGRPIPAYPGVSPWPADQAELGVVLGILFVVGFLLYMMSVVLHYLLIAFDNASRSERRVLDAQVAARESEVRALRAQLNPHFLFNSLNSINSLIGAQPEDARRMCANLGDFLRRTLSLGRQEAVPLADELALVERYLSIERVRFGDRLQVQRDSTDEADRCLVPPLLLQPLVENAIKHGIADRIDGGRIRIDARCLDGDLVVTVENDFDADGPVKPGEGVGIENVRQRLIAFAAREARLDVGSANDVFRVTLRVPARDADEEAASGA